MENEKLQYIYPYPDEVRKQFESNFISVYPQRRQYIISTICIIITGVLLVSYALAANILLLTGAVIAALAGLHISKFYISRKHLLEINAYETYITLRYFSEANDLTETITLPYTAITSCKMADDKYNCATLRYDKERSDIFLSRIRTSDNSELPAKKNGRFFFRINEYTSEQEFFLYFADKLFHTQNNRKNIIRMFGTLEEYHCKYIELED